ncbi:MAG: ATP-binding cassette domain-containing protein [Chloroflexi bacterium]|nr:ATP-binding cassette domain-containing protein [Chloroflexota bacterium]
MSVLLQATSLTKRFGALTALQNVHLDIYPGEVVGLAGSRGAGKTTLARILAGLQMPDKGELVFDGRSLSFPFSAAQTGISLIHEEPMLSEQIDVTGNIFLGHEIKRQIFGRQINLLDRVKMDAEAQRLLALLEIEVPSLHEKAANLTGEARQLIGIAQGMATPAQLRIVDDPTASLSSPYQAKLLSLIESWQGEGTAVLFCSQNLDHLFAVADRIVVIRQGVIVANRRTDETNREEIVAAVVGTGERQQLTPVIWALDSYYQAKRQAETLRHNQLLLEKDLAAQDSVNQDLLEQLSEQVQALDSANLALQDAQRRLLTEREEERKHLSRELHDETIQDLLSVNYQLEEMAGNNPALVAEMDDLRHHIRQLVSNVRGICGDLRPPTIDSLGLDAALQSYTHTWSDRTGIDVALTIVEDFGRLPEAIELSIFRIVQEGLSNVWKHAEATAVQVALTQSSPRLLHISIADNGTGLPPDFSLSTVSNSGHYGLLGLSERVALMRGRLSFRNQAEGGLLLQVEIPHPRKT